MPSKRFGELFILLTAILLAASMLTLLGDRTDVALNFCAILSSHTVRTSAVRR